MLVLSKHLSNLKRLSLMVSDAGLKCRELLTVHGDKLISKSIMPEGEEQGSLIVFDDQINGEFVETLSARNKLVNYTTSSRIDLQ